MLTCVSIKGAQVLSHTIMQCIHTELAAFCELAEAFVPYQKFYDETINYFDIQRLGGLMSHLKKTYKGKARSTLEGRSDRCELPVTQATPQQDVHTVFLHQFAISIPVQFNSQQCIQPLHLLSH